MLYLVSQSSSAQVPELYIILMAVAMVLPYIAVYVLRSIGLYKLAKNNGTKGKAFAFIPLLWFYTACCLIGNVRFFGRTHKSLPVVYTLIFSFATILPVVYDVIAYLPLVGYYLQGGIVSIGTAGYTETSQVILRLGEMNIWVETAGHFAFNNPYPEALYTVLHYSYYFVNVLNFALIFIRVPVYFDLFRKYWPQRYFLAGLLSILLSPYGFPIFIFIIRNKKAVNYNDYMRQKYNGFYGNTNNYYYGGQNPFGNNGYGNGANNGGYGGYGSQGASGNDAKKPDEDDPFPEFKDK